MFITSVSKTGYKPSRLLRQSYREGKNVKSRTLLNLRGWSDEKIALLQQALNDVKIGKFKDELSIDQSLAHGHVAACRKVYQTSGLSKILKNKNKHIQSLVEAMIISRVIDPRSKQSTAVALDAETRTNSLNEVLGLGHVHSNDIYRAMDWLVDNQRQIEKSLAKLHLSEKSLVLYDMTSTWVEGEKCPLAAYGYSRDGKKEKRQIVFGLLCSKDGCPVAVETYSGNTSDPKTVTTQVLKLKKQFGLSDAAIVGDRGMLTSARLKEDVQPHGLDWISALNSDQIRKLINENEEVHQSLFEERDMARVESPDFPGERFIICRNPILGIKRDHARCSLLDKTEKKLLVVQERVRRQLRPLRGKAKISSAVTKILEKTKMKKHFNLTYAEDDFVFSRNEESIAAEAKLDGFYVIRTSLSAEELSDSDTVASYKRLSNVERAFRSLKTVDINVRPIFHWTEKRVKAHILLCMLAYYLEWHLRRKLAPLLYDDERREEAANNRTSPVAKAEVSDSAKEKRRTKRTVDNIKVISFRDMISCLANVTLNKLSIGNVCGIIKYSKPTAYQKKALELLEITLE